jgi:predicted permease
MAKDAMLAAVRQSLRTVARAPLSAATAILCLGAGMAATTSAFAILNAIVRSELPGISDRGSLSRLVIEMNIRGQWVWLVGGSVRTFEALQAHGPAVSAVAAEGPVDVAIRIDGDTVSVTGAFVSGNYFTAMGTQPRLGRLLGPADDGPDAGVAVIGAGLWRRQFDNSPDVLGRALIVGGRQFRVIGVAPERFTGLELADFGADVDDRQIWLPLSLAASWPGIDRNTFLKIAVRHAPGVSRDEAARDLNGLVGTLEPPMFGGKPQPLRVALREHGYGPRRGWDLEMTAIAVTFLIPPLVVLAIACANVANLRLARATAHVHELAVRLSLGATRGQVVRLLALESALLTVASAGVAWLFTRLVLAQFGDFFPMPVSPDLVVLVFVIVVACGALLASGVAPAWRVARALQASGFRQTAQSGGLGHSRLRNVLVGAQVALSIGLLTIGALSLRTLEAAGDRAAETTRRLVVANINLEQAGYDAPAALRFGDALLERLQADPRVEHAGIADVRLFLEREQFYSRPGEADSARRVAMVAFVTPDWFGAAGLRPLSGRLFTTADRAAPVAVINESMARALEAAGGAAVGTTIRTNGFQRNSPVPVTADVIGIVRDAVRAPNRIRPQPALYLPLGLSPSLTPTLYVRTAGPDQIVAAVRQAVTDIEPRAPWAQIQTGTDVLAQETTSIRYFANAMGGLGLLALVLATAGLYAVTLYVTSLRTREIGIRVAIGAQQRDIIRLILRQALTVVGVGCAVGLMLVVPIAFAMQALFVGISPLDPLSLGPTVLVLFLAGLAAAILPALRAARVDPIKALRQE